MQAQDMAVFRAMRSVRRCARFPLKLPHAVAPGYSKDKGSAQAVRGRTKKGGNWALVKRIIYLALVALVAMLILMPAALAQDAVPGDDDPLSPEQNVVVIEDEDALEQAVGKQVPEQIPDEPIDEPGGPAPKEGTQPKGGTLPKSGGVPTPSALLVPAAALLLGSGIVTYALLKRRRQ
jgi:hypothetical protein